MSYLQKIVDYVSTTLSKPVAAKPAKVHKWFPDHHQQISSKCQVHALWAQTCWNTADCSWVGARGNQPVPADACNGCYWTTAGKQNRSDRTMQLMASTHKVSGLQATSSSMSPALQAATQPASSAAPIAPDSTALQKHEPPSDPMLDPPLQASTSQRL